MLKGCDGFEDRLGLGTCHHCGEFQDDHIGVRKVEDAVLTDAKGHALEPGARVKVRIRPSRTAGGDHADDCPSDACLGFHLPGISGEVRRAYRTLFGDEVVELVEYDTHHRRSVPAKYCRVQRGRKSRAAKRFEAGA